jgi:hypothetical protein
MSDEAPTCRFCGRLARLVIKDVTIYQCGSRSHHIQPFTPECWQGLVWKLKERIEALEKDRHTHYRGDSYK